MTDLPPCACLPNDYEYEPGVGPYTRSGNDAMTLTKHHLRGEDIRRAH